MGAGYALGNKNENEIYRPQSQRKAHGRTSGCRSSDLQDGHRSGVRASPNSSRHASRFPDDGKTTFPAP